jgi:hypothetical protein
MITGMNGEIVAIAEVIEHPESRDVCNFAKLT